MLGWVHQFEPPGTTHDPTGHFESAKRQGDLAERAPELLDEIVEGRRATTKYLNDRAVRSRRALPRVEAQRKRNLAHAERAEDVGGSGRRCCAIGQQQVGANRRRVAG